MTITWHLEKRKIKDLKDYSKNPRKLTKDQATHLQTSLEKFGIIDKPFINHDNTIIGGHQRVRILKKLGHKEIDVLVPDRPLEEKEFQELNIRHNKNTGEWDYDILANDFDFTDLLNWGFDAEELLGDMAEAIDPTTEEDSEVLEPVKDEDAITKLGDLYELNDHRLVCGDTSKYNDLEKLMGSKKCDLLLTDPPYNIASENKVIAKDCSKSMKNLSNSLWDKNFNPDEFMQNVFPLLKDDCSVYVFTSHHLASQIWNWMKLWADHYSWCVWSKPNPMPSLMKRHWTWNGELICYATRGKHIFNFPKEGHALCVWELNKENPSEDHPTQKPISLMAHAIKHSSNKNSLVLDCFLGSGTTLIAAEQLNRTCYGIELSPAYCDIIVNRWKKYMTKAGKPFTIKRNGEPIQWAESSQASQSEDQKQK